MKLHSKYWFMINASGMTSYSEEELNLLWETFSTSQLDFIQEMCENSYKEGVKVGEEHK